MNDNVVGSNLVAHQAKNFTTAAVLASNEIVNDFNLFEQTKGKKVVLFFYPLNFTFVCPSELVALNNKIKDFSARNTEVIAISVDSQFSHLKWRNTSLDDGGIGKIDFTLASDVGHIICKQYGVLHPNSVAFRATFIIDEQRNIRSQMVNDLPIGRNIDEILRIIDAISFHQEHGEVCPANWRLGKKAMQPTTEGVAKYLSEAATEL